MPCIIDATVLIDFEKGQILEKLAEAALIIKVTDFVAFEVFAADDPFEDVL